MIQRQSKSQPKWTDVKAKLASFDRAGLLGLVQDLYAAHPDNRTFLHTRFGLGEDVLEPYKQTIDRWLWPDAFRKQYRSVAKAKQAISNYKKAVGDPAGLAELRVFYCGQASGFASDLGYQDESYLNALVRMFDQALSIRWLRSYTRQIIVSTRRACSFWLCSAFHASAASAPASRSHARADRSPGR